MIFDAGLGPGNLKFFGPQMALINWLDAISQGPKNSRFPPTCPRNLSARFKTLRSGLYKSEVHK